MCYFLGFHVNGLKDGGLFLSQQQYLAYLLTNLKATMTPMEVRFDFATREFDKLNDEEGNKFRQTVGAL